MIWPNPATNLINLQVRVRSVIRITDINGKSLFDKPANPGITEIPLDLPAGFYIVQILGENNEVHSIKLVVK